MASRMSLKTWFDPGSQHVGLQINEGETEWAHITLELPEFTDLLRNLADYRVRFTEQVPDRVSPGERQTAIFDPNVELVAQTPGLPPGTPSLLFRHPNYGWLGFSLPKSKAEQLAAALLRATGHPVPDSLLT